MNVFRGIDPVHGLVWLSVDTARPDTPSTVSVWVRVRIRVRIRAGIECACGYVMLSFMSKAVPTLAVADTEEQLQGEVD